jgi:hypothetical protein
MWGPARECIHASNTSISTWLLPAYLDLSIYSCLLSALGSNLRTSHQWVYNSRSTMYIMTLRKILLARSCSLVTVVVTLAPSPWSPSVISLHAQKLKKKEKKRGDIGRIWETLSKLRWNVSHKLDMVERNYTREIEGLKTALGCNLYRAAGMIMIIEFRGWMRGAPTVVVVVLRLTLRISWPHCNRHEAGPFI